LDRITALFQNRSQLQIPFGNLIVAYFAQSLMFVPVLVRWLPRAIFRLAASR
jgi:hypothetical protein